MGNCQGKVAEGSGSSELTRRGFLKGTVAAYAALALAGSVDLAVRPPRADAASGEGEIHYCCCTGNCGGQCFMQVHVRDGKACNIVRQEMPNEDNFNVCQRGYSHIHRIYDPDRVKYPMRRVEGTARGAGEWERLSWDEAISYICDKWKGYISEFGPSSISVFAGTGNYRNDTSSYINRFTSYMGATAVQHNYDANAIQSMMETLGSSAIWLGSDHRDFRNYAKTIFIWGANPVEANTTKYFYLQQAHERGAHLVCIDPIFSTTAMKADDYVSIRPGTDGLLAIAMMQLIAEWGLQDFETLKNKTVAPFLVKRSDGRYLRLSDLGQAQLGAEDDAILVIGSDGDPVPCTEADDCVLEGPFVVHGIEVDTAYSLLMKRIYEWSRADIAAACDLTEDKIEEIARWYVDGPTTIFTGYGIDHWANGHTFYLNVAALAMLSGNIAKRGATITGDLSASYSAMGANPFGIDYPMDGLPSMSINGVYLPDVLETGKYGQQEVTIKSLYAPIHNFLGNQAGRADWLKALEKIELIVVPEVYMTESAKYADVVLPVPHYFELDGYYGTGSMYMRINEAAIDPQFESMGDLEIINLLAAGMGLGDKFTYTREDYNRISFENELAQSFGISWDRLKKEKFIEAFPYESYNQGLDDTFGTPTGRAQFYFEDRAPSADIGMEWDYDRERMPYWEPPHEAWYENELFSTYPLTFMTERAKFKTHTQFGNNPMLLELDAEPTLRMSVQDAEKRGLETGDMVRVWNDRGYMVCRVALSAGNRPGVVQMDHGWHESQFIEGHYQALSSRYAHPRVANNDFFDCLVEVEKYQ